MTKDLIDLLSVAFRRVSISTENRNRMQAIMIIRCLFLLCFLAMLPDPVKALPPDQSLEMQLWAAEPQLRDPVALSFDNSGRLYVVQSARRSSVDIDIRQHKEWVLDDLGNQSIHDLRQFFRQKMAPKFSDTNRSWLEDRNHDGSHDWKDLQEVTETIQLLEDRDGDRKADHSTVFATGFQEEITGVAAGVMPLGTDVFFTVYPDLWRLSDANRDGVAEKRQSVHRGFGVHAAFDGHDLHGLTIGPEGKIYFSVGDNGFSIKPTGATPIHYPNTGGVLRMNPDGSELEVFAIGLRNVQEIAFDEYGNLFSVDNDGDLANERERFVYIVEGGDSGWRLNWQFRTEGWSKFTQGPAYNPWIEGQLWKPHFQGQAAYIVPPISNYSVGPGGFKYNPGTALNDHYRGHFFLCQFPVKKITSFQVRPNGASFSMTNEHTFHEGLMASSINFGPDGALYIADWDGMWSPNGRGKIYRVDEPKAANGERRKNVAKLLQTGLRDHRITEVSELLGHPDQRIRRLAQFELVRRQAAATCLQIAATTSAPQLARIHALWSLLQMQAHCLPDLTTQLPWQDADPEIRAQVGKLAGDMKLDTATKQVRQLLQDPSARVRFHAAISIGKLGAAEATNELFQLAKQNANRDPMLRHAVIMGLANATPPAQLALAKDDPSVFVRSVCVVALRKRRAEELAHFLTDSDPWVRRETAAAIHDDFSPPIALKKLAARLNEQPTESDPAIIRRAISANFRLGRNQDAARLINCAADASMSLEMRLESLNCLMRWAENPSYDRVVGRIREREPQDVSDARNLLQSHIESLLQNQEPELDVAIARLVRERELDVPNEIFARWFRTEDQPLPIRIESLKTLAARNSPQLAEQLEIALATNEQALRATAFQLLTTRNPQRAIDWLTEQWPDIDLQERQAGIRLLAALDKPMVKRWLSSLLEKWSLGQLEPELYLDVQQAIQQRANRDLLARLQPLTNKHSDQINLLGGDAARGEHIFKNHVTAQCVRCHLAGGGSKQAGPELQEIGKRVDRTYLYEALIEPSKKIAKGYQTVVLETDDGRQVTGNIIAEDESSLTIMNSTAKPQKIAKQSIESRRISQLSTMPSMKDVLTQFEIRDLIEYLSQ